MCVVKKGTGVVEGASEPRTATKQKGGLAAGDKTAKPVCVFVAKVRKINSML